MLVRAPAPGQAARRGRNGWTRREGEALRHREAWKRQGSMASLNKTLLLLLARARHHAPLCLKKRSCQPHDRIARSHAACLLSQARS